MLDRLRERFSRTATSGADRCRRKFLRFFPRGFADAKYLSWERDYKVSAHEQWHEILDQTHFKKLLKSKKYLDIAAAAARIESRTNLLFSFEKMAFRDAVREKPGAKIFSEALYDLLYEPGDDSDKFMRWCEAIDSLPRKQTRVLTHPVVTIFPFIAAPDRHIFLKPNTTKRAASEYGFDLSYNSRPSWSTYSSLLRFADMMRRDLSDLKPRDMIDIQSFIWVIGSDEYRQMS